MSRFARSPRQAASATGYETSNVAGIGGEQDRKVRKEAAMTETAWALAGREVGVQVWRVEMFQVRAWPRKKYGQFYIGDSYIILNTIQGKRNFIYHIHYWIGNESSIDERGTAAYKTVELCDYMDGRPSQTRQRQNRETADFRVIFPNIEYLQGGIQTGFRQVVAATWQAQLLQVRKTARGVVVQEVTLSRDSLNEGDCFILDLGRTLYVWQGSKAHPLEKYEANAAAERIESRRKGQARICPGLDETFWRVLGGQGPVRAAEEGSDNIKAPDHGDGILYKLTDETGKLEMYEVARGSLTKAMLDTTNVMILDMLKELHVWVGANASMRETRGAWISAQNLLKTNGRDPNLPIHMVKEGQNANRVWQRIFDC